MSQRSQLVIALPHCKRVLFYTPPPPPLVELLPEQPSTSSPALLNWYRQARKDLPVRAQAAWDNWSTTTTSNDADPSTLKHRVLGAASRVLERIPWQEVFLKRCSGPDHVRLLNPPSMSRDAVSAQLRSLVCDREAVHRRLRIYSAACLPVSVLASVIPGPNLPLLYNAFRLYSHHTALTNAQHLHRLLDSPGTLSTYATEAMAVSPSSDGVYSPAELETMWQALHLDDAHAQDFVQCIVQAQRQTV
ncbi:hypothetical protein RI367_003674 [Sorochytrium milnesiophthora]